MGVRDVDTCKIERMVSKTVPHLPTLTSLSIGLAAALPLLLSTPAHAREGTKPKRSGGQAEVMVGPSACVPGRGECQADGLGASAPSLGLALNAGWRAHPAFFVGAGYGIGWFNPTWQMGGQRQFRAAYQQSVFGVLRAYIPVWRIDIGFEASPGWSRQTFVSAGGGTRSYSQGFALRPGLSVDIWVGRHVFIGAKVDSIFNFHREVCSLTGRSRTCTTRPDLSQARVHQLMGGVHVGGTF